MFNKDMIRTDDLLASASFGGGGGGGGGGGFSRGRVSTGPGANFGPRGEGRAIGRTLGNTAKETAEMLSNPNATPRMGDGGDAYTGDPAYGGRDGR